jgi:anaerobic selenocysteine-containing dehydrogenase
VVHHFTGDDASGKFAMKDREPLVKPRVMARHADVTGAKWTRSICGMCSLGCGVEVAADHGKLVGIRGRPDHRVNFGRLGPKGLGQWQANRHPARGTRPRSRGPDGSWIDTSWDDAMARVVAELDAAIAIHGPSAVAFYNSGQLLLEEYFTLAKIARAGLGTPNIDANTRLCTATTGDSLMASFGADGPPGAFEDFDTAECIVLFGHNAAEQSTVLWMRIMAARSRERPPKIIAIDPRRTETAEAADLHLAPRPGTNVALIDGILRLVIHNGWIDRAFIEAHTIDFDRLRSTVEPYDPEHVEQITGVPAAQLQMAAQWIGTSASLITTCLQGVYQSNQATATACAVNTLHLITGKIGKPGSAPFQFAGQPSSMNTRECGADGAYPGYRNWANPAHMKDLAKRWNVPVGLLGQKPVSAPEIFDQCAEGQIRVLFVLGTNPAASYVDRARTLAALRNVFLVVLDPFVDTETVELADVYLPTAMWGEKTGCMTNAERRCNLVQKVVEPPGEARADFDVLIDLARRMHLVDKSGAPLIGYSTPRDAFEEWKACSAGTIPDYSGMSYEMLLERGGVQWPCNAAHPDGTPRLYVDARFPTDPEHTEGALKDPKTGHAFSPHEYEQIAPGRGRARLLVSPYEPPLDLVDNEFPFVAISGRQVYHWHTRTKTAKVPELADAAPRPFVAMHAGDAAKLAIEDGDLVRIASRRGELVVPAKLGENVPQGVVFVPFHYGDLGGNASANAVASELHDPVSKQPEHKYAAVRIEPAGGRDRWWEEP